MRVYLFIILLILGVSCSALQSTIDSLDHFQTPCESAISDLKNRSGKLSCSSMWEHYHSPKECMDQHDRTPLIIPFVDENTKFELVKTGFLQSVSSCRKGSNTGESIYHDYCTAVGITHTPQIVNEEGVILHEARVDQFKVNLTLLFDEIGSREFASSEGGMPVYWTHYEFKIIDAACVES